MRRGISMKKNPVTANGFLYGLIMLQIISVVIVSRIARDPEQELLRDVLLFFLVMTGLPVIGGLCAFCDRRRREKLDR